MARNAESPVAAVELAYTRSVCAGVSCRGKSELRFVPAGVKIDGEVYHNELLIGALLDLRRLYPEGDDVLYQDGAPAPSHAGPASIDLPGPGRPTST